MTQSANQNNFEGICNKFIIRKYALAVDLRENERHYGDSLQQRKVAAADRQFPTSSVNPANVESRR